MAAKRGVPRQMAVISGSVFHPKWQIPTRAHDPFATGHRCADAWTARLLVLMDTGKRANDHKRQADDSSLGDRRRRLSVRLGVAVGTRPAPRTGGETYDQERRSRRLNPSASVDRPLGSWDLGDHGRCNRTLLGNLLLKPIPLSAEAAGEAPVEIGWHLHPDAQGFGYATEAAEAVLVDAAHRGLSAMVAVTDPRNTASQRVCSRLSPKVLLTSSATRPTCS